MIADNTNIYANTKNSDYAGWTPTDADKMNAFIAMNIRFGVDSKPDFRGY
jgi:hypothetical protein